jgi:hypothetical protein
VRLTLTESEVKHLKEIRKQEGEDVYYLYNPIPLARNEMDLVIKRILKSNRSEGFNITDGDINLDEFFDDDVINRMRFKNVMNRLISNVESRGFAAEGFMSGLLGGVLSEVGMPYDYQIREGKVEQKFTSNLDPSITKYSSLYKKLDPATKQRLEKFLKKRDLTPSKMFRTPTPEIDDIKEKMLEELFDFDMLIITTTDGNNLLNYYFYKDELIEMILTSGSSGRSDFDIRLSPEQVKSGSTFKIIKPRVTQDEFDYYLKNTDDEDKISMIFGDYKSKIRPDIIKWIIKNKEQFVKDVNMYLGGDNVNTTNDNQSTPD